jgi:hypothetical protein
VFISKSKLRAFGKGKNKKDKVAESASGLDDKENGDNNSTIAKNKSKDHTPVSFLAERLLVTSTVLQLLQAYWFDTLPH